MFNPKLNETKKSKELKLIEQWIEESHQTIQFKQFKPVTVSAFEIKSVETGETLFTDNPKHLLIFNDWLNPDFVLYEPDLTYKLSTLHDVYQKFMKLEE